ncbi:MAG: metallophosphoesterase [Verrucomicrobiales bacterium]
MIVRHECVGTRGPATPWRIAHLSDFHIWFSQAKLRAIESALAQWNPDFVAMTGDYADTPWGRRLFARWLRRMSDRWTVGWIAGNHDRWLGGRVLRDLTTIPNAHCVDIGDLRIPGPDGMTYRITTWDRGRAIRQPPPPPSPPGHSHRTIALCHDPQPFDPSDAPGIDLALAGHLHGGQIVLGRDANGRALPGAWLYRWCLDRLDWNEGSLIVSRGLGDTFPLRINCPQEIVIIDLW